MKKIICTLLLFAASVAAFAQGGSVWKQMLEITELEIENEHKTIGVYDMPEGDQHQYFACLGTLGVGTDIVQIDIDPAFELFIPLGNTLAEAQDKLAEFKAWAKKPAKTQTETVGTLALANPSTGTMETVYLTSRRLLGSKIVEFSVQRNGYVRATYLTKSQLGTLLGGVKFYRKLHPKQQ